MDEMTEKIGGLHNKVKELEDEIQSLKNVESVKNEENDEIESLKNAESGEMPSWPAVGTAFSPQQQTELANIISSSITAAFSAQNAAGEREASEQPSIISHASSGTMQGFRPKHIEYFGEEKEQIQRGVCWEQ
jgi:TolA-binding protein